MTIAILPTSYNTSWYDPQIATNDPVVYQNVNLQNGNLRSVTITTHRYMQDRDKYTRLTSIVDGLSISVNGSNIEMSQGHAIINGRWIRNTSTYSYDTSGLADGTYYFYLELTEGSEAEDRNIFNDSVNATHIVTTSFTSSSNKLLLAKFSTTGGVPTIITNYGGVTEVRASQIMPAITPGGSSYANVELIAMDGAEKVVVATVNKDHFIIESNVTGLKFINKGTGGDPVLSSNGSDTDLALTGHYYISGDLYIGSSTSSNLKIQHSITSDQTVTFPDASFTAFGTPAAQDLDMNSHNISNLDTLGVTTINATTINASTLTTTSTINAAGDISTDGNVKIKSGTSYYAILDHSFASADQTFTFPEATGTLVITPAAQDLNMNSKNISNVTTLSVGTVNATDVNSTTIDASGAMTCDTLTASSTIHGTGDISTDANIKFKSGTSYYATIDHNLASNQTYTLPLTGGTFFVTPAVQDLDLNSNNITNAATIGVSTINATTVNTTNLSGFTATGSIDMNSNNISNVTTLGVGTINATDVNSTTVDATGGMTCQTLSATSTIDATGDISTDANIKFKSGTSYYATFDHSLASANRTYTLPDAAGTVMITPAPNDLNMNAHAISGITTLTATNIAGFTATGDINMNSNSITNIDQLSGFTATGNISMNNNNFYWVGTLYFTSNDGIGYDESNDFFKFMIYDAVGSFDVLRLEKHFLNLRVNTYSATWYDGVLLETAPYASSTSNDNALVFLNSGGTTGDWGGGMAFIGPYYTSANFTNSNIDFSSDSDVTSSLVLFTVANGTIYKHIKMPRGNNDVGFYGNILHMRVVAPLEDKVTSDAGWSKSGSSYWINTSPDTDPTITFRVPVPKGTIKKIYISAVHSGSGTVTKSYYIYKNTSSAASGSLSYNTWIDCTDVSVTDSDYIRVHLSWSTTGSFTSLAVYNIVLLVDVDASAP